MMTSFDGTRVVGPGEDKAMDIVPHTCDGNVITNSEVDSTGSKSDNPGVRLNHPCQGMKIENTTITSPSSCLGSFDGATVVQTGVTCKKSASAKAQAAPAAADGTH